MTNEEYKKYADRHAPRSPLLKDMLFAFLIGGFICCLGQLAGDLYRNLCGLDKEAAASATSITLVFLGALLTGLGVYDDIAKLAGAGTLVPITGFANSVVARIPDRGFPRRNRCQNVHQRGAGHRRRHILKRHIRAAPRPVRRLNYLSTLPSTRSGSSGEMTISAYAGFSECSAMESFSATSCLR